MKHYFCPCCGKPMTVDGVVTMPRSGKTYTQLTCDNPMCQAWRCTTSDVSVLDGSFVAMWHFKPRFEVVGGQPLGLAVLS